MKTYHWNQLHLLTKFISCETLSVNDYRLECLCELMLSVCWSGVSTNKGSFDLVILMLILDLLQILFSIYTQYYHTLQCWTNHKCNIPHVLPSVMFIYLFFYSESAMKCANGCAGDGFNAPDVIFGLFWQGFYIRVPVLWKFHLSSMLAMLKKINK